MQVKLHIIKGDSILDSMRRAGCILPDTSCGGKGLCGKCLVKVISGGCPAGIHCACQCHPDSDVVVDLPGEAIQNICDSFQGSVMDDMHGVGYGVALDIGTTTLALLLVDLRTGIVIDKRTALNVQRAYGADVIARIAWCNEHADGLGMMQKIITEEIISMIKEMMDAQRIDQTLLARIVVAANTTMMHLLVGADPSGIAVAPFTPRFLKSLNYQATELSMPFSSCTVSLIGGISAYVGADIVAGIYSSGLEKEGETNLLLDLGTNGEICLWDKDTLVTCSCASGPVFEGACISCGTGSVQGAIDKFWQEAGILCSSTIGGTSPVGICGSGIIDLVSILLTEGIIDETGAMERDYVIPGMKFGLTRKDVREIQLAKAAVAAGVDTLLASRSRKASEIDHVFLAGGFGSFLRPESAINIGMLRPSWKSRIIPVGNTSLKGALAFMTDSHAVRGMEMIRENAQYIELSSSRLFQKLYVDNMVFPS